ncbi:MAG: glycerophosphodiester phosphodiesterase [Oscillospiraceae bacterium]|jgi:glycerophosphoryl diester phosphodiesterase|nr:glycerophosphodiester phosphodiesterase [Oscillospiraceae bacterium]
MPDTNHLNQTKLTAHAGALHTAPNTAESIRAGLTCIGDGNIEVDVRFSPAGVPVLAHDAVRDENACTLAECFRLAKAYPAGINLDLKESRGDLTKIRALAEQYQLLDRVFFTGIRAKDVPRVRGTGIPYYLNVYPGWLRARLPCTALSLVRKAKRLGAVGLNLPYYWARTALVRAAHTHGLEVSAWTVDAPATMRRLLKVSVDNITTRKPDLLFLAKEGHAH